MEHANGRCRVVVATNTLLFGFKIREQASKCGDSSSGSHKDAKLVCQLPEAAVTHLAASHSRSEFCPFWCPGSRPWWDCAASGGSGGRAPGFFQLLVAAWPHQSLPRSSGRRLLSVRPASASLSLRTLLGGCRSFPGDQGSASPLRRPFLQVISQAMGLRTWTYLLGEPPFSLVSTCSGVFPQRGS